jgi:hypothetical protein
MDERKLPRRPSDYQEDHFIPLELGSHPTDLKNLWPQPNTRAERKDQVACGLNHAVCDYRMPLKETQLLITDPKNW